MLTFYIFNCFDKSSRISEVQLFSAQLNFQQMSKSILILRACKPADRNVSSKEVSNFSLYLVNPFLTWQT